MKIRSLAYLLTLLLLPAYSAWSQVFYTESGNVGFRSESSLVSFNGISNKLIGQVDLDKKTVDFYVDLLTIETGISKRDNDMYETLEVDEYPFAEFFGKIISDFNPNISVKQSVVVKGEFKVHGVSRTIEVDGTLQMTKSGLNVKAGWTLLLEDYEIEPPSLLSYKVSNEMKIRLDAKLKAQ